MHLLIGNKLLRQVLMLALAVTALHDRLVLWSFFANAFHFLWASHQQQSCTYLAHHELESVVVIVIVVVIINIATND